MVWCRTSTKTDLINDMSLCRGENRVYVFLCMVLLAVKMIADVTETRNAIPCLEFKIWTAKVLRSNLFHKI